MTTPSGAIPIGTTDLLMASILVMVAGAISITLRLGMEKRLLVASIRTVVQLLCVGYLLQWIFKITEHPLYALLLAVIMVAIAGDTAVRRQKRSVPNAFLYSFSTLIFTSIITCIMVTGVVIQADPWWTPRYFIPLLGMILGNGLNGISLSLDYLLESLSLHRPQIEMELSLGASKWEAARRPIREAVRRGMIPITNSMMIVGIVSLPGMMTGQILSGEDPLQAAKYQIVVMFMIAATTSASCILLAMIIYKTTFNEKHQLTEKIYNRE